MISCSTHEQKHDYAEEVKELVQREIIPEFQSCYLINSPPKQNFKSEMTLRFVVNPDGSPSKVTFVGPAFVAVMVQECVKTKVATMRFRHPPEGEAVLITAPMLIEITQGI